MDLGTNVIWANFQIKAGIIKPSRTVMPEAIPSKSGCLIEGSPLLCKTASQWGVHFFHALKTTTGTLMGSPTSNVEAWEGRWRRNKAESHSVSSWSSEQRVRREQPHEGARGNTENKSLCEETNSSSPNLVSSRVQISFNTALLGLLSSLPGLRAALHVVLLGVQHGHPPKCQMAETCEEHNSMGLGQSV